MIKTLALAPLFGLAALGAAGAQEAPKPAATATAPAAGAMPVYGTALAPGWENWSWAKTELSFELEGSARKPIAVDAAGWQALYLHHAPFSTAPYTKLKMLINTGVGQGKQALMIKAVADGKPIETPKTVTLGAQGWTRVEVPLASIAAKDVTIDGIWVQNASAEPIERFYVTEIAFE